MSAGGMTSIAERLHTVQKAIAAACHAAKRPVESVTLVAASKGQPAAALQEAYDAGQCDFGENYASELKEKMKALQGAEHLRWHFIGRVQESNCAVISRATLVHGVGSLHQAQALSKAGLKSGVVVPVLLQVNLEDEETKNGFLHKELEPALQALRKFEGLRLRGLMAMPRSAEPRQAFAAVRAARDRLCPDLRELSMGMSGDFGEAIAEGATLVRIGTAIFGPRPQKGGPPG